VQKTKAFMMCLCGTKEPRSPYGLSWAKHLQWYLTQRANCKDHAFQVQAKPKTSIHTKAKPKHVLNGDQIYSSREQVKFFSQNKLRWYIIASSKAKLAQVIMNSLHKSSSLLLAQANARNIQMEQDYMIWYGWYAKCKRYTKELSSERKTHTKLPPQPCKGCLI